MTGYPKLGELFAGHYRIVRQIGQGGMGSVFVAVDETLGRRVAIKVVVPTSTRGGDFRVRFEREAYLLARVRSRHIVPIHDYGEVDETLYLVTDHYPDGDLQSWLVERGPMPTAAALDLVSQVLEALADAHAADIVHRDVKPSNVLLWDRPEGLVAYLADFGIASDGTRDLTRTGVFVGSPAYTAPERHFDGPADERGDVYSAGCLLWAALSGEAPYSGTDYQVVDGHIRGPIPQLDGTGEVVDRINRVLTEVLAKDPEQRIPTAARFRDELRSIRDALTGEQRTSVVAPPRAPTPGVPGVVGDTRLSDRRGGDRTRLKSVDAPPPAPPGTPPPSAPPAPPARPARPARSGDEARPQRRRGGRLWIAVAAAVVVLAVVFAAVAWSMSSGGDDKDPREAGTTPTTDTTPPPPLPPPTDPPGVAARPAYRSVVFDIDKAGSGLLVEVRRDGEWETATRRVPVPTPAGGMRACISARLVATDGDRTAPGLPARTCGRSQPATVDLVPMATTCSFDYSGSTYPCRYYEVRLAGFETGTRPLVELHPASGGNWCTNPTAGSTFRCRTVPVGPDGRGALARYIRIYGDPGMIDVVAGDVRRRVHLVGPS